VNKKYQEEIDNLKRILMDISKKENEIIDKIQDTSTVVVVENA